MRLLHLKDPESSQAIKSILFRGFEDLSIEGEVREILENVKKDGDKALFEYALFYDGAFLDASSVKVRPLEMEEAYGRLAPEEVDALRLAADRVLKFHQKQTPSSWITTEEGAIMGQLCHPLKRVGLYIPGGKAPYPSSVLMTALPARAAGVEEIAMCTPVGPDLSVSPSVLVAADLAGVREIYKVGGPHAIAAMAYGTESVPKVEKIVGPGNIYVTMAKKLVYGRVCIDMIAGPSEVLVIADSKADPAFVAADLLSQAEHDERAVAILITPSEDLAIKVIEEMNSRLEELSRKEVISAALEGQGLALVVEDLYQALDLANEIAPEHLELLVEDPWSLLNFIRNAGAIFIGPFSPEVIGDYMAGPSHVLPTGGTARFLSPLSTETFLKRTSLVSFSSEGLKRVEEKARVIARMEGLTAHEMALKARIEQ